MSFSRRVFLGVAGLGLVACGDDSVATVDELAVLKDLADIVARPSYATLKTASDAFKSAVEALVASASEATLTAAQAAWKETQRTWNQTRSFAFGPAKDIEGNIRWKLGCDVDSVEETITAGPPFEPSSLGTSRKGLPALEYLLFDPEGGNAAIVEKLVGDADRLSFVGALAAALATQIDALVTAWDAHAGELATAGEGSEVFKSPKDAMDAVYNQMLYVADLAIAQIKDPLLGSKGTGGLSPALEEARLSDNTLSDTFAQLASVTSVFEGSYGDGSGLGLTALLRDRSPDLDDQLRSALAAAKESLEAIPPPLRTALAGDLGVLNTTLERLRDVKKLLTADIATALGVTISFSDMDGD